MCWLRSLKIKNFQKDKEKIIILSIITLTLIIFNFSDILFLHIFNSLLYFLFNELVNSKEVRIWTKCKLFNCLTWTERKILAIPDLPHKWNKPGEINSEWDWVKFEEVEKCEKCAKLTDKQIVESKLANKIHEEVGDELTSREIKNHGWTK